LKKHGGRSTPIFLSHTSYNDQLPRTYLSDPHALIKLSILNSLKNGFCYFKSVKYYYDNGLALKQANNNNYY
jgi:hypothetical protein